MFGQKKVCSNCHKNMATHFFKSVVNGKSYEINLCDECASKSNIGGGFDYFWPFMLNDEDYFGEDYVSPFEDQSKLRRVCKCGTTEEDILNTGRFGCAECYKTFSDIVQRYVNKLGGATYAGKMPEHVVKKGVTCPSKEDQIIELEKKMHECVQKEDYMGAAEYKKKIEALKGKK